MRAEVAVRLQRLPHLSLVVYPDAMLRAVCEPVERFDSSLQDVVQEMFDLLQACAGIGLAGPQVGLQQRVMIGHIEGQPVCLVNPEIQDTSEPGVKAEGCLSLPGVQVNVARPERLRVAGYDPCGRKTSFGATGLWARVMQHEIDHLNGVLICDHARPSGAECQHCTLSLPAVLVEERKHHLHPGRQHLHLHRKKDS